MDEVKPYTSTLKQLIFVFAYQQTPRHLWSRPLGEQTEIVGRLEVLHFFFLVAALVGFLGTWLQKGDLWLSVSKGLIFVFV